MQDGAQRVDELGPPPLKGSLATLTGSLAWIPLKEKIKGNLYGGYYISQFDYLRTLNCQYDKGALLGRAMRNKLSIFEKMLILPGEVEGKTIKVWQNLARERLAEFRKGVGRGPDTFEEFTERGTSKSLIDYFFAHARDKEKTLKVFSEKIPLEEVLPYIWMFGLEGIGFGSLFPGLTVKMWHWGPAVLSTEQETYLQFLAYFTLDYYPELLDPLDLRKYLQE